MPIRIDRRAVGFPGDSKDHGANGWESAIAAGLTLGDLEKAIQGPQEAVDDACLGPGAPSSKGDWIVRGGPRPSWTRLGAADIRHHGFPIRRTTRRLAARDLAKRLAGHPDVGRAFGGHVRPQGIEVIPGGGGARAGILQGRPTQALQGRIAPSIGATRRSRACEARTMTIASLLPLQGHRVWRNPACAGPPEQRAQTTKEDGTYLPNNNRGAGAQNRIMRCPSPRPGKLRLHPGTILYP